MSYHSFSKSEPKQPGESKQSGESKRSGETKVNKRPKPDPLGFKSNSKPPMCYFSNFFGGAEFTFMSLRTNNMCLKHYYEILRDKDWDSDVGYQEFKDIRVKLGGKNTDHYRNKDGKTAAGVLAKLISGCWRKSMTNRLKAVNKLAAEANAVNEHGLFQEILASDFSHECLPSSEWTYLEEGKYPKVHINGTEIDVEKATIINGWLIQDDTASNKKRWMMEALRLKYANQFFRELLLNSEDGIYERKGPRDTKLWCGNEYTEDKDGEPTAGLLMKCLADTKFLLNGGTQGDTNQDEEALSADDAERLEEEETRTCDKCGKVVSNRRMIIEFESEESEFEKLCIECDRKVHPELYG